MNTDIMNECKQYEQVFNNALKLNFMRLSMDDWNKIAVIYEKHFNRKIKTSERGCGNCRLRIVKELGAAYLNEQAKQQKAMELKKAEQVKELKNTEKPKKKGRPKKINLDETEQ